MMDYLFYSIFRALSQTREKDIAEYTTVFILGGGIGFHLLTFGAWCGFNSREYLSDIVFGLIIFVIPCALLYFRFLKEKRFKMLEERYKNLSKGKTSKMNAIAIFFVLESIGVFILTMMLTKSPTT